MEMDRKASILLLLFLSLLLPSTNIPLFDLKTFGAVAFEQTSRSRASYRRRLLQSVKGWHIIVPNHTASMHSLHGSGSGLSTHTKHYMLSPISDLQPSIFFGMRLWHSAERQSDFTSLTRRYLNKPTNTQHVHLLKEKSQ